MIVVIKGKNRFLYLILRVVSKRDRELFKMKQVNGLFTLTRCAFSYSFFHYKRNAILV